MSKVLFVIAVLVLAEALYVWVRAPRDTRREISAGSICVAAGMAAAYIISIWIPSSMEGYFELGLILAVLAVCILANIGKRFYWRTREKDVKREKNLKSSWKSFYRTSYICTLICVLIQFAFLAGAVQRVFVEETREAAGETLEVTGEAQEAFGETLEVTREEQEAAGGNTGGY